MAGTGLPIPKTGDARSQAPGLIDGDKLSSAQAWQQIAASGAAIASDAQRVMELESAQQQAKAIADFETQNADTYTKLRDQYQFDPKGYENAARAHNDGALSQVPSWMAAHAKKYLEGKLQSGLGTVLTERRARDHRLASESIETRLKGADNDLISMAMAGKFGTDEWTVARAAYDGILKSAVTMELMTPDKAAFLLEDLDGRAQGETMGRDAVEIYRAKGIEAATEHLRKNVLENDSLPLGASRKYQIFNRAMSHVKLRAAEDRADRGAIVELAKDITARLASNQPVDPAEIRDVQVELRRTGAIAWHNRLARDAAVAEATRPYRDGSLTIGQFGTQVARMRGEVAPGLQYTITNAAHARNVSPGYMMAAARRESAFNPDAKAETSSATGLFQFIEQTWLGQFKKDGAAAGYPDLAGKIERDGNRWVVTDPAVRQKILDLRKDPGAASHMMAGLTADNRDTLKAGLGRDPTDGELYAAHFLGADGALQLLKASPAQSAASLLPGAAAANRGVFYNKDGSARTVSELVANLNATVGPGDDQTLPGIGAVTQQVQREYVRQAQAAWPAFKDMIERGRTPSEEDFASIRYAAKISGNANWLKEVDTLAASALIGRKLSELPASEQAALLDQMAKRFEASGWTVETEKIFKSVQGQMERQRREVAEDPVSFGIRTGAHQPVAPLNLADGNAAAQGLAERINIARSVAARQDVPVGTPLRESDRQRIAAVIAGGSPQEAGNALALLNRIPDDMLLPALASKDIRDAVAGAARTKDPARFGATMSALDALYARAPATFTKIFGEETWHRLKTWQANLRYFGPEKLAEELSRVEDPQVRARREANEAEGRKEARKKSVDEVVAAFDLSWGITPGIVSRNLTGSTPTAPTEPAVRDALMGDYETVFARRYAETLDAEKAHRQTVELMKTRWARSEVNNGQLMLRPPEAYYPAVGGSHAWMKAQIEDELTARFGPRTGTDTDTGSFGGANWNYVIVPDRITDAEAQRGERPSYRVVVTDNRTGRADLVRGDDGKPLRFRWDSGPVDRYAQDALERFQRERSFILSQQDDLAMPVP